VGLDTVETVIGIEEAFGIEIPNSVAQKLVTPGHVVDYIVSVVPTTSTERCLTQQLFYRVRRGFRRQIPALARDIELDTPIGNVLHEDQWQKVWRAIWDDVGDSSWPVIVPWKRRYSPDTVRHLVWYIVEQLPKPRVLAGESWTRPKIEAEIRRVVREVTGIQDFSLRDRWVEDLHLD